MPFGVGQLAASAKIAANLRASGVNTILYTEQNALKKKFRYADRMGFDWVVLIGDDEVAAGEVSLKNMATGESRRLAMDDVAEVVGR